MTTRNMRGESISTVTRPGWVESVTVRALRGKSANRVFYDYNRRIQHTSQKAWQICFQGQRINPWAVVLCSDGYFVICGASIITGPFVYHRITKMAREMADKGGKFWAHVLEQRFSGRDPQCEECLSGSPVAHVPFHIDHRIHCTCDSCF